MYFQSNQQEKYDEICADCGYTVDNWTVCLHCLKPFCKPCMKSYCIIEAQQFYDYYLTSYKVHHIYSVNTYNCNECNDKLKCIRVKYIIPH